MMGVMVVSVAAGAACGEGPATQAASPKAVVLEQVAGPVYAGAFSKDGRVVVLGGKNGLFILDDKGRLVKQVGTSAAVWGRWRFRPMANTWRRGWRTRRWCW
jgi:hypothetical protein